MNVIDRRRRTASTGFGPIPRRGESFRTPIPDNERGIQFEIGKMREYVRHFSGDPLVVRVARRIVELCPAKDKTCEMNAIYLWTKGHFRYVNDPPSKEVIATPLSQISDIMTPPEVLEAVLGPKLIQQIQGFGVGMSLLDISHPDRRAMVSGSCWKNELTGMCHRTSGDCDEASTFLATMLAAVGIVPRFRFGGTETSSGDCNYHHVWVQGQDEHGGWVDMDITEPDKKIGWFFEGFDCTGYTPIF